MSKHSTTTEMNLQDRLNRVAKYTYRGLHYEEIEPKGLVEFCDVLALGNDTILIVEAKNLEGDSLVNNIRVCFDQLNRDEEVLLKNKTIHRGNNYRKDTILQFPKYKIIKLGLFTQDVSKEGKNLGDKVLFFTTGGIDTVDRYSIENILNTKLDDHTYFLYTQTFINIVMHSETLEQIIEHIISVYENFDNPPLDNMFFNLANHCIDKEFSHSNVYLWCYNHEANFGIIGREYTFGVLASSKNFGQCLHNLSDEFVYPISNKHRKELMITALNNYFNDLNSEERKELADRKKIVYIVHGRLVLRAIYMMGNPPLNNKYGMCGYMTLLKNGVYFVLREDDYNTVLDRIKKFSQY